MKNLPLIFSSETAQPLARRAFLRYAGATSVGAALLLAGCKDDDDTTTTTTTTNTNGESVSLGTGDVALLNLLQAGKQISATLVGNVVAAASALGLTADEQALLSAIARQQKIHRDTLKAAVNATRTTTTSTALNLADLPADFSSLDLTQRTSALTGILSLLNTLVGGAVGALRYSSRSVTATMLGQVLSVDARHAATVARLLPAGSLTDLAIDGLARNRSLLPSETIAALNPLITSGSRLLSGSLA